MGHFAQALASEESLAHNGKTYRLSPVTFDIMAQWEFFLENRAWDAINRRKSKMLPHEFAALESQLLASIAAGDYSFWSMPSLQAQNRPGGPGYKKWLELRLRPVNTGEEITDALLDELIENKIDEIMFKLRKLDQTDPNSQASPVAGEASNESKVSSPAS